MSAHAVSCGGLVRGHHCARTDPGWFRRARVARNANDAMLGTAFGPERFREGTEFGKGFGVRPTRHCNHETISLIPVVRERHSENNGALTTRPRYLFGEIRLRQTLMSYNPPIIPAEMKTEIALFSTSRLHRQNRECNKNQIRKDPFSLLLSL